MDQLICASLSHTHYWYEVGMLKVQYIITVGLSLINCRPLLCNYHHRGTPLNPILSFRVTADNDDIIPKVPNDSTQSPLTDAPKVWEDSDCSINASAATNLLMSISRKSLFEKLATHQGMAWHGIYIYIYIHILCTRYCSSINSSSSKFLTNNSLLLYFV